MKKFLSIIFLLYMITLPANSAVTDDEMMSDVYLRNHGHSEEMVRLIDLQDSQINGTPSKYVNQTPKWYDVQPFISVRKVCLHLNKNRLSKELEVVDYDEKQPYKFVRRVFMYFDKGLDDGKFMQNNIDYSNRFDDL